MDMNLRMAFQLLPKRQEGNIYREGEKNLTMDVCIWLEELIPSEKI